ncbi:ABC transporter permease [Bacteroidota bacterium]
MIKNYIKISIRNIWHNKAYSAINIVGFAFGMACTILIMLWVNNELSYDEFHTRKDNIYRIVCDWTMWEWEGFEGTPEPLGVKAVEEIPSVEKMFRVASVNRQVFQRNEISYYENEGVIIDPLVFEMMSFPIVEGDIQSAFNGPNNIVISESLAEKYFGNKSALGEIILVDGGIKTITGVFEDIPENSHLFFSYAYSFEFIDKISGWGRGWSSYNFVTYLLVNDFASIESIGEQLTSIGKNYKSNQVLKGVNFRLQPLKEVYLDARNYNRSFMKLGDLKYVYVFSVIAVFVLLIACINFMNLSTAHSMNRSLEVGMRKALGANRAQLIKQFLTESVLLAFIAHIIAMILVEMILPYFNSIAGTKISTNYLDLGFIALLFGAVLLTGLVAGVYPALYLSSFKPVLVLRKSLKTGPQSINFRKFLVVFQFTLSIILIICTAIISKQISFMNGMELGFEKKDIVYVPMTENFPSKYEVVKNRLLQSSSIEAVTAQRYNFMETNYRGAGFNWEGRNPNRERSLDLIFSGIDYDYFETLKIPLAQGRNFSKDISADEDGAIILNEAAIADMEIESPVGKWFEFGDGTRVTIIGVAKDVYFRTLKEEIDPRIFYISDLSSATEGLMMIKVDGSRTNKALEHMVKVWNEINSASPFEYNFLDDSYNRLYESDKRTMNIFNYFTILAILISCLGLFGLASFSAERRIKEIGVRKVMGASIPSILLLLVKDFTKWILIANFLAWPLAYYLGSKLLDNYAYKTSITIDLFLLSGILALFIAAITISYKSYRAAVSNAIDALRYE